MTQHGTTREVLAIERMRTSGHERQLVALQRPRDRRLAIEVVRDGTIIARWRITPDGVGPLRRAVDLARRGSVCEAGSWITNGRRFLVTARRGAVELRRVRVEDEQEVGRPIFIDSLDALERGLNWLAEDAC